MTTRACPSHRSTASAQPCFKQPRESSETQRESWRKRLHLSDGEQLDVVGVVKRLGQQRGQGVPRYPSVTRVAADPWLGGVKKLKPNQFRALTQACQTLSQTGDVSKIDEGIYGDFPYEGAVVYKNRHSETSPRPTEREVDLVLRLVRDPRIIPAMVGGLLIEYDR